ncbi:Cuticle protein 10.9 [Nymphon striatum]|nr:Cuticle protein 10.9 [Nymphon striatum]
MAVVLCIANLAELSQFTDEEMFAALCLLVVSVYGSRSYDHPRQGYGYAPATYETNDKPEPYEFSYEIVDDLYNTQARQESGDAYGYKTGSYSMKNAEGLERIVEYIADEAGFRAVVKTNEPGTDNQNPADVEITATPVEVKEAPKKVVKDVHVAPSYGHRAYAAPSYGHRAYAAPSYGHRAHGYGTPAYGQTHGYGNYERNYGRTHQYEAKKPHGVKATGHASTTYSAGYGNDGYKHSVAKVHSRRYEAPTYGYSAYAAPSYRHAAPAYGYGYKPVAVKVVKEEKKEEVKEEQKEEEVKEISSTIRRNEEYIGDIRGFKVTEWRIYHVLILLTVHCMDSEYGGCVQLKRTLMDPVEYKKVYVVILHLEHMEFNVQGYGYAPATYETNDKPEPYEFSYEIVDDLYNTQARQESGDAYGYKTGSYSMKNAEGLERIVEYIADEAGFRAVVKTNEPGTDNQNPADVEITATPIEVKEAPKKVVKKVHVAPSYGHPAYAAPSYGHRAHGYGTPAYGQTHGYGNYERNYGRTHQYEAKKPHGIKATGHASTTYSAGYGNDGYKHSVAKVHSRRYEAPTYGYSAHAAPSYRHAAPAYGYGYKPVAVKVVKEEKEEELGVPMKMKEIDIGEWEAKTKGSFDSTVGLFAALCLLVVSVYGSRSYDHPRKGYGYAPATYETYDKPAPYEFSYEIVDDYYNTQARQESGDAYGYKTGSYSMKNAEGLERIVEYIADEAGFRAVVKTNEPGTDNQNPADVEITATPVEVKEAPKKVVKEVVEEEVKEVVKEVAKKVHVAPSYGHRAYAAPSYGHRAYAAPSYGHRAHGYGTPAYGQTHGYGNYERNYGRTHNYEAKKPHGIKATGHASTTYSAGYGNDGYKHSVAKVHSRRYEAPTYGYCCLRSSFIPSCCSRIRIWIQASSR